MLHLDGLRVRIGEEEAEELPSVQVGKRELREICEIRKSSYDGYLLKILPEAEVGSVF